MQVCSPRVDVETQNSVDFNRLFSAKGRAELPGGQSGQDFGGQVVRAGLEDTGIAN